MIVYRCSYCFEKCLVDEYLICKNCYGIEFFKEDLRVGKPESTLPQSINSRTESKGLIGEVKMKVISDCPCLHEAMIMAGKDFIYEYNSSVHKESKKNEHAKNSKFDNQYDLSVKEQLPSDSDNLANACNASPVKPKHLMGCFQQLSKARRGIQSSIKRMVEKKISTEGEKGELTGSYNSEIKSCISHVTENKSHDSKQDVRTSQKQTKKKAKENSCFKNTFSSKEVFKMHIPNLLYGCGHCQERFATEPEICIHLQNHNDANSDKMNTYKCEDFSEEFSGKCEDFSEEFSGKWMLKQYCKVHLEENSFKCGHCDYWCKFEELLIRHMKRYHPSELEVFFTKQEIASMKDSKSEECLRKISSESELNIQMKIPCGEPNYSKPNSHKCCECPEEFPYKWMLKDHLMVHWDKMPFQCGHCDYGSIFERFLTKHMKRYHASQLVAYFSKHEILSKKRLKCVYQIFQGNQH